MHRRTKEIHRPANHRPADERKAVDATADALVKAAYLELMGMGVHPSVERMARSLRMCKWRVDDARARLIATGAVPVDDSLPYAAMGAHDDPFTEHPDDPDADDVKARIAEIRAEKEARHRPRPMRVTTARHHRSMGRLRAFA